MKILQEINLDFARDTLPITVFAKQYDQESRFVKITPLNHGQPCELESGVTARLQVTKADKTQVINDATIEDGVINAELTAQVLAAEGVAVAEIGLYKGDSLLSSQSFYVNVRGSAYDQNKVKSSDEYGSLVDALSKVDKAVEDCNTAASGATAATAKANTAASSATQAVGTANTAASNADKAAERATTTAASAATAAGTATAAAEKANTAASGADAATAKANTAAGTATAAAEAAEKVNIAAEQTPTGADITVTDRKGEQTTVHIDTLLAVDSWADIRNAVRLGLGEKLFPPGYEFTTVDSDTGATIVWAVRGHDKHKAANDKLTHTMTIEAKYVYGNSAGTYKGVVFDAPEALYSAPNELPAGTYHFTIANQAWYGTDNNKDYQFTLTKAVPAGGQIFLAATYNQAAEGKAVRTYASPDATDAIESVTATEGSEGTSLGKTDGTENTNYYHRIPLGSNNYAQSAVRQWLNSDAAAGSVWKPTNKFDRAPSWATTYNGFMHGLPADFLEVVQAAAIPCRTNSVCEIASLDGTEFTINQVYTLEDKFFLLSRPEIYGSWDSASYKDGELLPYYDGLTNAEKIKRDAAGAARYCWLRSPYPGDANSARLVYTDGSLNDSNAYNAHAVAPACIIA